ncbi:MAG: 2-iminoacetate synthase [Spirochaetales bacterium]|jgi:2-iminoacetate synthase|nr:2-iminoacetate synthase [Spirochaetales bacterium]
MTAEKNSGAPCVPGRGLPDADAGAAIDVGGDAGATDDADVMRYQDGMEVVDSSIMERVLEAVRDYSVSRYGASDVRRAIDSRGGQERGPEDFAALLSPAAAPFLEDMARQARRETRARFGNSVYLFTPLYLANYCENQCVYCGFNCRNPIKRSRLDASEIEREMKVIAASGLEEILLLTGESGKMSGRAYIGEACELARKYFRVVGLEVYPMNSADYAWLRQRGADFVTVFQETYDPRRYAKLHPGGRKRVFPYRFNAQERALLGGIRGVGFAALLGLADFRKDAFATGMHARLIQRRYPHAEISFSCPRLRPWTQTRADSGSSSGSDSRSGSNSKSGSGEASAKSAAFRPSAVGQAELLQIICAYRLFMPCAGITVSSRENAWFRDHVTDIAATKLSAGVDVGIGGHTGKASGDSQFEIDDGRSVTEIHDMILARGLQPVMSEYIYV